MPAARLGAVAFAIALAAAQPAAGRPSATATATATVTIAPTGGIVIVTPPPPPSVRFDPGPNVRFAKSAPKPGAAGSVTSGNLRLTVSPDLDETVSVVIPSMGPNSGWIVLVVQYN